MVVVGETRSTFGKMPVISKKARDNTKSNMLCVAYLSFSACGTMESVIYMIIYPDSFQKLMLQDIQQALSEEPGLVELRLHV